MGFAPKSEAPPEEPAGSLQRSRLLQVLYAEVVLRGSVARRRHDELAQYLLALGWRADGAISQAEFAALHADWTTRMARQPHRVCVARGPFERLLAQAPTAQLGRMVGSLRSEYSAVQAALTPGLPLALLERLFDKLSEDGAVTPTGLRWLTAAARRHTGHPLEIAEGELVTIGRFVTGLCACGDRLEAALPELLRECPEPEPDPDRILVQPGMRRELRLVLKQAGVEQAGVPAHITPAYLESLLSALGPAPGVG